MATDFRRMRRALTVMLALYFGMQFYAVARADAGLALAWPVVALLAAWVVLMTAFPLLVWRWEQRGRHRAVLIGAWVGYLWMGVVFLFFWISLGVDLLGALLRFANPSASWPAHETFLLDVALTAIVSAYGFVAARRPRIERVTIRTPKLPEGVRPLRIALVSDVHLGALIGARRLGAILDKLRALDPDVLISAGDLVDGQADRLNGLAPMIAAFQPRHGKFAVTGNHEYFVGIERALEFHDRAGFRLLQGAAASVDPWVAIAGVDDPTGRMMGSPASIDERAALGDLARERFTILVKHQPLIDSHAIGRFDLQLSGHVHRGQIFPFGLLVRLTYRAPTGLSRIAGGGWLYVSRGTGTWGPPMRVAAPAEITIIELMPLPTLGNAASP